MATPKENDHTPETVIDPSQKEVALKNLRAGAEVWSRSYDLSKETLSMAQETHRELKKAG